MTRFISLASGSSGNCYYIGNERTALLVDVGIGGRTIKKRLAEHGISVGSVEMIFVTHDHSDHIRYLASVAQKLSVPVFATSALHDALERNSSIGDYIRGCRRVVKTDTLCEHRGVKFASFKVPHDAAETLGYYIDFFGEKFVFMTDLGSVPDYAKEYCRRCGHLIIESNYDRKMLDEGPYEEALKRRITEGAGHLSNSQCASAITEVWHEGLQDIFLCHLSHNNNTPELAYSSASSALASMNLKIGTDIKLSCLPRGEASSLYEYFDDTI